jgi:hypothetical protein
MMKQYEKFETIMKRPTHVQTDTPQQTNTLCSHPQCYSNCHIRCALPFAVDPNELRQCASMRGTGDNKTCYQCKHLAIDHRHFHVKWEEKVDSEVIVDEDAKNKFHSAVQGDMKYEALLKQVETAIRDLDSEIQNMKTEIGTLCTSYQSLALSGSFAGQISSAVRLLRLNLEKFQANGTDAATIDMLKDSIKQLDAKKKLVEDAAAAANATHVHHVQPRPSSTLPARLLPLNSLTSGIRYLTSWG